MADLKGHGEGIQGTNVHVVSSLATDGRSLISGGWDKTAAWWRAGRAILGDLRDDPRDESWDSNIFQSCGQRKGGGWGWRFRLLGDHRFCSLDSGLQIQEQAKRKRRNEEEQEQEDHKKKKKKKVVVAVVVLVVAVAFCMGCLYVFVFYCFQPFIQLVDLVGSSGPSLGESVPEIRDGWPRHCRQCSRRSTGEMN